MKRLLLFTASIAAVSVSISMPRTNAGAAGPASNQKPVYRWQLKRPIQAPEYGTDVGEFQMSIEDGWFVGDRRNQSGDVEWKIVLAKEVGDEKPELTIGVESDSFRVCYRDRYFIRDDRGCLRCLRQLKMDDDAWPAIELPAGDGKFFSHRLRARACDSWMMIAVQPVPAPTMVKRSEFLPDCILRLAPEALGAFEPRDDIVSHGVIRSRYGKWFVIDDSEFLIAEKLETWRVPWELNHKLQSLPAPGLAGHTWVNTEQPPMWESLRGKPVLLLLFDLEQPTFVPLIPPLLAFVEEYAKRGLKVIGVHAQRAPDEIRKRLADERIMFPVLVDDGEGPRRYGVPFSSSVLLDRWGNVKRVNKNALVAPADIERLLPKQKRPAE